MLCKLDIGNVEGRKERLELLRKKIKVALDLRKRNLIKEHELQQLKLDISEFNELEIIERCRYSLLDFAFCFFSKDENEEFDDCVIPKNTSIHDAPEIHKELCEYLNKVAYSEEGEKLALSLPRGMAKSSYVSKLFPIWVQCYRLDIARFIVILSETVSMANRFLDYSRNALKFNNKLREFYDFGLDPIPRLNEKDNANSYVSKFPDRGQQRYFRCMVYSSGLGSQLRGLSFYSWRPTLILADDCESAKNTNTAELRANNISFWNSVVEPLGNIGNPNSSYIYIGTQIHSESLLNDIMSRPSYHTKSYSAIVKPPSIVSTALWDKYEEIYRDRDNPNREEEAEAFYQENKFVMDSDTETLWSRVSYKKLMQLKVELGVRSWMSEYLNIPPSSSGVVFEEKDFVFYNEHELPEFLEKYSFWDIAITDKSTSDFNAIVTIGRDRRTGILYCLEAKIFKAKMHIALEEAVKQANHHRPLIFGIESVQAQTEMLRQFSERLIKMGIYNVRPKGVRPQGKKQVRIEQLQPLIENGTIRFRKADRLLLEQLIGYPNVNDDGPDSLQQCINLIRFRRGHLGIKN